MAKNNREGFIYSISRNNRFFFRCKYLLSIILHLMININPQRCRYKLAYTQHHRIVYTILVWIILFSYTYTFPLSAGSLFHLFYPLYFFLSSSLSLSLSFLSFLYIHLAGRFCRFVVVLSRLYRRGCGRREGGQWRNPNGETGWISV